ncbi:hypothetical protein RSOLAG1IB_05764 [Rhizoctonia solani AG-1 IB]|uniref:Uncharacterized protein n=1 Tax=Thanatephorus cucumeris (strain AG1-IB / isolate 7/3/14) TaxID=1108050 RepID=A0A0B7F6Q9_THACB|nr:hypothetical protein RSOLAG1IB_05764 [Rhizoctonia solani AG-1 IB]
MFRSRRLQPAHNHSPSADVPGVPDNGPAELIMEQLPGNVVDGAQEDDLQNLVAHNHLAAHIAPAPIGTIIPGALMLGGSPLFRSLYGGDIVH